MANIPDLVHAIGNNLSTTLASPIDDNDLVIQLSSGIGFNPKGGYIKIDEGTPNEEIIYLESVTGTTAIVATNGRGVSGTSAHSHNIGAVITDIIVAEHVEKIVDKLDNLIDVVYPVGSIYISTVATNPGTVFGVGTWVAFGTGRTIVGVDTGQTEFDTVEKTGGAKTHTLTTSEMPSHTHIQNPHTHNLNRHNGIRWSPDSLNETADGRYMTINITGSDNAAVSNGVVSTTATNQNTGGGAAHNNLQPYITVYMFKRTA